MECVDRHARTGTGDVKRVKGRSKGDLRLRVGDWRIFFVYESEGRIIVVNRVVHRSKRIDMDAAAMAPGVGR